MSEDKKKPVPKDGTEDRIKGQLKIDRNREVFRLKGVTAQRKVTSSHFLVVF